MTTYPTLRKIRHPQVAAAMTATLLVLAGTPTTFAAKSAATPQASKSETAGVASGLAIGAAAGGPIGAIVGAAAGGWFGDRLHREKSATTLARDALARTRSREAGLTMHVMFRTDDAQPRADDEALVAQFATLAAGTPGAVVHVTGYTDPRGSARHNATLAAERAAQVAARLEKAGLASSRLVVSSETTAAVQAVPRDLDGYAFQRRVTLKIALPAAAETQVAQRR